MDHSRSSQGELEVQSLDASLIAQLPDAMIYSDATGTIRVWNAAAERIFGFTQSEAIGANLDIIIPERFRDAHWRGFERALGDKRSKYVGQSLPTRSQHKDGTGIVVELSFAIVVVDDEAVGALAIARDITERFEKERADRKRLQELETARAKPGD